MLVERTGLREETSARLLAVDRSYGSGFKVLLEDCGGDSKEVGEWLWIGRIR